MTDLLSRITRERANVATLLSEVAFNHLRESYRKEFVERAREFKIDNFDPSAAEAYLKAEIERDVIVAFDAHADWLASHLWWRKLHEGAPLLRQPLPRLTPADLRRIASK